MSKVFIIPDVHLKPWMFEKASQLILEGSYDTVVMLGDLVDDWYQEKNLDLYNETFDAAVAFANKHKNTIWCYGNHDVSYLWGKLESGYSPYAERTVIAKLKELENSLQEHSRINIIHRIDNVLFSHGGITTEYVKWLGVDLLDANIDDVIARVNDASYDRLWNDESPLWFRPQYKTREIFRADLYKQVVGHTPVKGIYEKNGIISTDVFSTYRDGTQIGESAMIVIDSKTGEYKKIDIKNSLHS